jgi:tRNA (adenine57-N1/adenine58-N1)-methyltransferase
MFKAKRKTTVVYPKDLGLMILETAIGPGSHVIDIGTGSGVMALVLAQLVAPDGMIFSYERREEFIGNAQENIERVGSAQYVTCHHWDAAEKGFKETNVDAIFIDVPEPWTIVPHAAEALKGGHHLISWSPNVEQVKRTVEALEEHSFTRIKVSAVTEQELLVRQQGVRPRERGITHTAYLVRANKVEILNHSETLNPKL